MIHIFDHYGNETRDLHQTLKAAGYAAPTVVLMPDGFLPEDVISPFTYFLGKKTGKPRFFNQIQVPAYWEILGTSQSGQVMDHNQERARILYNDQSHRRFVKQVDWLGPNGQVRITDHYDQYGTIFAKTILNPEGQPLTTSYLTEDGEERLVENHVTGDLILTLPDQGMRVFPDRISFYRYFLEAAKLPQDQICFNSLATPFLLSYQLSGKAGQDFLFWQEPLAEEIPGNMQLILDMDQIRCQKIIIPDLVTYERALRLVPADKHHKLATLGYDYPFKKDNFLRREAFILTNSDQIEQLEFLVQQLPDLTFRIAALTEMSSKLMSMQQYSNVVLYPNASSSQVENLFMKTDFFFDINYSNEVMRANRQAFEHNQVIFAFEETLHDGRYVAEEHIFKAAAAEEMVKTVQSLLNKDLEKMRQALRAQGRKAHYMSGKDFAWRFKALGGRHG